MVLYGAHCCRLTVHSFSGLQACDPENHHDASKLVCSRTRPSSKKYKYAVVPWIQCVSAPNILNLSFYCCSDFIQFFVPPINMDLSDDAPSQLGGSSGAPMETPRRNTAIADSWIALFNHRKLYDDIGNKGLTRGDIRLSFSWLRAFRGNWLEQKNIKNEADLKAMMDQFQVHAIDFNEPNAQLEADELLERIDRDLARSSHAYQDDRRAATAPRAARYYLDTVMRYHVLSPEKGLKCPNGQPQNFFGEIGASPDPWLIAICDTESSFFSYFVVEKLMHFYYGYLYYPLRKFMLRTVLGNDPVDEQVMRQQTHDILVAGLEASLSCALMTGSIVLLVKSSSQTHQLIAMAIMNLLFIFVVIFLSSMGKYIFVLCAAFWAVVVSLILRGSLANHAPHGLNQDFSGVRRRDSKPTILRLIHSCSLLGGDLTDSHKYPGVFKYRPHPESAQASRASGIPWPRGFNLEGARYHSSAIIADSNYSMLQLHTATYRKDALVIACLLRKGQCVYVRQTWLAPSYLAGSDAKAAHPKTLKCIEDPSSPPCYIFTVFSRRKTTKYFQNLLIFLKANYSTKLEQPTNDVGLSPIRDAYELLDHSKGFSCPADDRQVRRKRRPRRPRRPGSRRKTRRSRRGRRQAWSITKERRLDFTLDSAALRHNRLLLHWSSVKTASLGSTSLSFQLNMRIVIPVGCGPSSVVIFRDPVPNVWRRKAFCVPRQIRSRTHEMLLPAMSAS
ncbi:unnamed protein product [Periconia digitata]|uniref:DUF6594 domain-containing protein n=1 Tax=Periconia digitata TaxID=1303443 RepID=A0A9W4U4Q5_9PLEO|nr:unnamed protein product [Periconia digitata]